MQLGFRISGLVSEKNTNCVIVRVKVIISCHIHCERKVLVAVRCDRPMEAGSMVLDEAGLLGNALFPLRPEGRLRTSRWFSYVTRHQNCLEGC